MTTTLTGCVCGCASGFTSSVSATSATETPVTAALPVEDTNPTLQMNINIQDVHVHLECSSGSSSSVVACSGGGLA